MKRLAHALLRIYPRPWRTRYGAELLTLLEDTGSVWPHIPDILLAALKMRFQMLNWRLVGAFALTGLTLAAAFALNFEPHYTTTAQLECTAAEGTNPEALKQALLGLRGDLTARKRLAPSFWTRKSACILASGRTSPSKM